MILLAGVWQARELDAGAAGDLPAYALGAAVAFAAAWLCIHFFLRWVARFSLLPFVVYRIVLGVILLAVFL